MACTHGYAVELTLHQLFGMSRLWNSRVPHTQCSTRPLSSNITSDKCVIISPTSNASSKA